MERMIFETELRKEGYGEVVDRRPDVDETAHAS